MKFFLSRNHKRNIKTLCRWNFKRYSFQNLTSKGFCKHEKSTFHFRSIEMDSSNSKNAGSSLEALMTSFNARILELQELVIARNSEFFNQPSPFDFFYIFYILNLIYMNLYLCFAVYPASSIPDLSAIDAAVSALELQVQTIKENFRNEMEAIPKAKVFSLLLLV